jgi:YfiH family protein
VSPAPFDSMNLRHGLGDEPDAVSINLQRLGDVLSDAEPVWLNQVHGHRVVQLQPADAYPGAPAHAADASISSSPGLACAVQVADCLPVLFSARGRAVAAAHAGWRGLAAGVLENTVSALCAAADCKADEVEAWLGPCIGPRQFEVGADVLMAFGVDPSAEASQRGPIARFKLRGAAHPGKWLADLSGLAQDRLNALGVVRQQVSGLCTVEQGSDFFSFRRDGRTGRMAAVIWIDHLLA